MNPLRPLMLAAAASPRMKSAVTATGPARALVRRFIAGEDMADALGVARALLSTGRMVTVDFLGEDTTDRAQADAALAEYAGLVTLLGDLQRERRAAGPARGPSAALDAVVPECEVSVKLSALGQALPGDGGRVALANLHGLCAAAQRSGVWVTVDAEDHTTTDDTLAAVTELRREFPWLGVVLQAYLFRTEADCKELAGRGSRVRLCKGAYREPKTVAHQSRTDIDQSYLRCLEVLMGGQGYPMVASHDPVMIEAAHELVARSRPAGVDSFEHQMLFGIRDSAQLRLAAQGYGVRVYVPYGSQWYGYFMRRLAERPANLAFFLHAVAGR
ncbi:MAG: proline dehydrogenase [Mycobacteriaceae bacterium]|nr:proline dehydrogenase [Mycobacteriaceae bacterium]